MNQLDNEEGKETGLEENQTAIWLKKNKLTHLIEKFQKIQIELDELVDLTNESDDFLNSLMESNTITSTDKIRIKRAVKLMNKPKNKENVKVVTVLVSDQEEAAMNQLNQQKLYATSLINELKKYQNEIDINTETCRNEIDAKFKNIFIKLEQQKQNIINELNNISQQKTSAVCAKTQQVKKAETTYDTALNSCNQLLQNCNVDRFERKQKILSLCKTAMNQKLLQNDAVNAQIILEFNDDVVSSFISSICTVYGVAHPLPVVSNVEISSISTANATISWNAALSKNDKHKKTETKLFMKVDCMNDELDQKEKDMVSSDLILFQKTKQKYMFQCNGLNKDSKYKMMLSVFEDKSSAQNAVKNAKQRMDFKSMNISFKTLNVSFKWIAQNPPKRNYQCHYDASNNGKILTKYRGNTTIDIIRMDPLLSKQKGDVYNVNILVEEFNNANQGDVYGFGVITEQRWNTDTMYYLGSATGSYWWKFIGGIFLGSSKKHDMPPIKSTGQTMGLELDFGKNTVRFKLFADSNMTNVIGSSIGTFDEMQN
eukprot:66918_1